ncbi:MAG: DUF1284 domain-containing protein [Bacillaceae bacterium]|nr:DUF1284 domain-containing protein [Bacillaceae bacterium]
MNKRILRGHHLLCVHGFRGMGYSSEFVQKMQQIVEEIRNTDLDFPVQVIAGLDETCFSCPHKGEGYCNKSPESNAHVLGMDRRVISHLGLEDGQVYQKSELVKAVKKYVEPEDLDELCKGCSWLEYGVCKEGIAELKKT